MKTSISFLKSKYDLTETLKKLDETTTDYIHVDVMDGRFVDNEKLLNIDSTVEVLKSVNKPLDIHLMCSYPLEYIEAFKVLKPSVITIHSELVDLAEDYLNIIGSNNIKRGLGINPETKISDIEYLLDKVDYCLIMGVHPGEGGQKLIPETLKKIDELKLLRKNRGYDYIISLDGGVNEETINLMSGLDVVVSGSFVCMNDDYQKIINKIKEI